MTKEILKAIRARCERTSEGPWESCLGGDGSVFVKNNDDRICEISPWTTEVDKNDSIFIAHSREDLPRLLDALEAGIKALDSFAQHRNSCGVWKNYTKINAGECTCGLKEALAAIDRILSGEK